MELARLSPCSHTCPLGTCPPRPQTPSNIRECRGMQAGQGQQAAGKDEQKARRRRPGGDECSGKSRLEGLERCPLAAQGEMAAPGITESE